jgi:hypothetical protein
MGLMPKVIDKPEPFKLVEDQFNDPVGDKGIDRRRRAYDKLLSIVVGGGPSTVDELIASLEMLDGAHLNTVPVPAGAADLEEHLRRHWLQEMDFGGGRPYAKYWFTVDPAHIIKELAQSFLLALSQLDDAGDNSLLAMWWVCASADPGAPIFAVSSNVSEPPDASLPTLVSVFVLTPIPDTVTGDIDLDVVPLSRLAGTTPETIEIMTEMARTYEAQGQAVLQFQQKRDVQRSKDPRVAVREKETRAFDLSAALKEAGDDRAAQKKVFAEFAKTQPPLFKDIVLPQMRNRQPRWI